MPQEFESHISDASAVACENFTNAVKTSKDRANSISENTRLRVVHIIEKSPRDALLTFAGIAIKTRLMKALLRRKMVEYKVLRNGMESVVASIESLHSGSTENPCRRP